MSGLRALIVAAFFLVLGFLLIILGCTVVDKRNAWPVASLGFFCLTPLPLFFCGGERPSSFSDSALGSTFDAVGLFLGGAFLASGPALALMLFHLDILSGAALGLTLGGGLCFLATSATIAVASHLGSDDDLV